MADFDYDLFVIGGGSGGVRAARISAEHGARVALAEEYRMGGTCVIRGCVPKKLMVYASTYAEHACDARDYGWNIQECKLDWPFFMDKLRTELNRLEGIYRSNLDKAGVTTFDARAVLDDAHTVSLSTGQKVTAKHILIATGGYPFLPDQTPGAELAISSNDVFLLEEQPKSMLIVGGGYIACEFACIFNGFDTKTTQYYRGPQILRGFDNEVRDHVAELIRNRGVDLHTDCDVAEMRQTDDGIWVKSTDGREGVFDKVLFATGRRPNTNGLGLEEIGVKLAANGAVAVDEYSQTSVPSIYAVGDVTDRVNLTPVAIREGHAFADTVFGGTPRTADHGCVASAVFTQPEMGTVGLSEEDAARNGPIEVYCTRFKPMQKAFIGREERVMFKLVVCADTRKVLGAHMVAGGAGEMVQLLGILVKMGATKEDFDAAVAVHPTMAEEIVLMKSPVRTG